MIAAIGVVFGDIGTSPLYALRECFHPAHGIPPSPENVLGILSLIIWSLILVVNVKYLGFIMRANNRGEGGSMALIALLMPGKSPGAVDVSKYQSRLVVLGLFGAALLYGDGIITPAISVLSAVEGLEVATPRFQPFVVPLTLAILIGLFSFQSKGTARLGSIFGPTTLVWFISIAAIALPTIFQHPEIFSSFNPAYAVRFFGNNGWHGFLILSAVVLCITGAEALYADMGHFGKKPIMLAWFIVVFPCLILNYMGQGALILAQGPSALENPFYGLAPGWLLFPMVILATLATVIASQAMISGAYSLTQQAIQLGYLPRTQISYTSEETEGQIYISRITQFLMLGSLSLVLFFQHSSNLAAAYGIAVTGTFAVTSLLFIQIARIRWKWPVWAWGSIGVLFLSIDLTFFLANIRKVTEGGWVPLVIALGVFTMMTTWKAGRDALAAVLRTQSQPLLQFLKGLPRKKVPRVPGTGVFMSPDLEVTPPVLIHHFKHNRVLHERVILLSIATKNVPVVDEFERVKITELPHGFYKVQARYGYMETPDISEILIFCLGKGLPLDIHELSFYLGRESILTTGNSGLRHWRKRLFYFFSRNARPATDYFGLPPNQVVELGSQVEI